MRDRISATGKELALCRIEGRQLPDQKLTYNVS